MGRVLCSRLPPTDILCVREDEEENQDVALRQTIQVTWPALVIGIVITGLLGACQPTVKVEAPKEPITINLNIKLDADVRVKLEEQAGEDIKQNPDIF